ncbi:MAG: hypothetical protein CMM77_12240 [Rhodospirillaceae bacterium]|nr:hypothetical protein [Magnetovibrio sp.]MAY67884.1 hypothetical protein [Rhodospirillaceae bacterium]
MTDLSLTPAGKTVVATVGGEVIAESAIAQVLKEGAYAPMYYFPKADVRMDALTPSTKSTLCPHKGTANYWTVSAGGRTAEDAAWAYETPPAGLEAMAGHIAFYPFVAKVEEK